MLNQERVCEMTKLAIFDKNEGQECRPVVLYFRKDYIAKELIKSFITGTIAFFLLAAAVLLYHMEDFVEKLNSMDVRQFVIRGILWYIACMTVYFLITYVVYNIRYVKGRRKVKQYYLHLKKVNRLYHEEEQV